MEAYFRTINVLTAEYPVCVYECISVHSQRDPILTCLPIGSGLVTVVEKKPSHSSLPYRPAQ